MAGSWPAYRRHARIVMLLERKPEQWISGEWTQWSALRHECSDSRLISTENGETYQQARRNLPDDLEAGAGQHDGSLREIQLYRKFLLKSFWKTGRCVKRLTISEIL